jgi:hypothetical protein
MKRIGLVLWGLGLLLSSCEKDGFLKDSGEKVEVRILLGEAEYAGDETLTRGYFSDTAPVETVSVPLGDGMFMFAALEEDVAAPTRAGSPLEEGVKVRVVAYVGSTSAVESSAEYTVTGGVLTTSAGMTVSTGTTYKFVAYSYNSGTLPTYAEPTVTVAPPNDLLWGSTTQLISTVEDKVSITMDHLYTQVRVKATTTSVTGLPLIKNMTNVTVSPNSSAQLTVRTGGLAQPSAVVQYVTWNGFNATTVTSNPLTVYTGAANPFYVNIGSVTIDGYSQFTNAQAMFTKALAAGKSYTLVVNFQKTLWAKSNIYWKSTGGDTGYLTFDTQENGHEGYQGVFFKWGSLVGISPAHPSAGDNTFSPNVPVYVPTYNAGTPANSTWIRKTGHDYTAAGWPYAGGSGAVEDEPENIPYADKHYAYAQSSDRSNTYLTTEISSPTDFAGCRGDICLYLSQTRPTELAGYRMPKSSELAASGWGLTGNFGANNALGNDAGTAIIIKEASPNDRGYARNNTSTMKVTFPASGIRNYHGGPLEDVGNIGYYWTSSIRGYGGNHADSYAYEFHMLASNPQISVAAGPYRSTALPVRCVKN